MDRFRIYLRIFANGLDVRREERKDSRMIRRFLSRTAKGIVGTFAGMKTGK